MDLNHQLYTARLQGASTLGYRGYQTSVIPVYSKPFPDQSHSQFTPIARWAGELAALNHSQRPAD